MFYSFYKVDVLQHLRTLETSSHMPIPPFFVPWYRKHKVVGTPIPIPIRRQDSSLRAPALLPPSHVFRSPGPGDVTREERATQWSWERRFRGSIFGNKGVGLCGGGREGVEEHWEEV